MSFLFPVTINPLFTCFSCLVVVYSTRPCTLPCTGRVHGCAHCTLVYDRVLGCVHGPRTYTAVCTVVYTALYIGRVHGRVRSVYKCTVYTAVYTTVESHYYDSVSVVIGHESYSTTRSRICSGLCCLCLSPLSFAGFLMNFSISPLFVVVLGDLHSNLVQSVQSVPDILRLPIYRLSYDNVGLLATFVTLFA